MDQMGEVNEIKSGYSFGGFWKDRRVLVTGAAGFLGSALASQLIILGASVGTLDVKDPQLLQYPVDLSDFDATLRAVMDCQPDIVFHLAAASQVTATAASPGLAVRDNIVATANLLEAIRRYASSTPGLLPDVVVTSSDKAYGPQPRQRLMESSALKPVHIYDTTKAAADLLAQCYGDFYNLPVAITRMANVYGPGDRNWRRLVPSVLAAWLRGWPPTLRSDGSQIREYLYVDDAILGLLAVGRYRMEQGSSARAMIFNLGSPFRYSANDMLPILCNAVRAVLPSATCHDPVVLGGATDETSAILLDSTAAFEAFGWKPSMDVALGAYRTTRWLTDLFGMEEEPQGL